MKKIDRESLTLEQVENYRQWLIDAYTSPTKPLIEDDVVYLEFCWCNERISELLMADERQQILDDWYWAFEDEE